MNNASDELPTDLVESYLPIDKSIEWTDIGFWKFRLWENSNKELGLSLFYTITAFAYNRNHLFMLKVQFRIHTFIKTVETDDSKDEVLNSMYRHLQPKRETNLHNLCCIDCAALTINRF